MLLYILHYRNINFSSCAINFGIATSCSYSCNFAFHNVTVSHNLTLYHSISSLFLIIVATSHFFCYFKLYLAITCFIYSEVETGFHKE